MNAKTTFTFVCFVLLAHFYNAATITADQDGNWNAPGTWDLNRVPACGDTIVVPVAFTVHVAANVNLNGCVTPVTVKIFGRITFANGRKLRLSAGSCVTIQLNGILQPSGVGGGSSEVVEIDGVDYWKAADGTLVGDADGVQLGCGILLPVELISFALTTQNQSVEINFSSASERNLDYYLIESSRDGSYWQMIEKIKAAGNSVEQKSYSGKDENPFNGTSYYRLKSIDIDGTENILDVIANEFYSSKFLMYPIPVNKLMFLEGENLEKSTVTIVNSLGEIVEVEMSLMGDKYNFNFAPIKNGVYFLTIQNQNVNRTERIIVAHK